MKRFFIYIFLILLILFILSSCIKIEPDFLLTLSNPDNSSIEMIGESYKIIDVIITPINGFSGNVEFSLIDDYFSLDGATNLTVNVSSEKKVSLRIRKADQAPVGNYNLKIKASSGTISKYINLNISIRDFEINSGLDSIQVLKDSEYNFPLVINSYNNFKDKINFYVVDGNNNPFSYYLEIEPSTIEIDGESTLTILKLNILENINLGEYNLKLIAKSESFNIKKEVNFTLKVSGSESDIENPSFDLNISKNELTLEQGEEQTIESKLTPINGFVGNVNLKLQEISGTTAPTGITIKPTQIEVPNSQEINFKMVVSVDSSVAPDTYNLRILASDDTNSIVKYIYLTLEVTQAVSTNPTFSVSVNKNSLSAEQGDSDSLNVSVSPENGFTGNVNFELQSLDGTAAPAGITIVPNKVNVPSEDTVNFTMVVSVAPSVAVGTYNLRIVASDDANTITKYIYLTLEVTQLNSEADFVIQLVDSDYNSKNYFEITAGDSINTFIKITPQNDFNGDIQFNIYKYDDSSLSPDFTISPNLIHLYTTDTTNPIMFTITNVSSVPGNYVVKIEASSENTIREIFINIIVK